MPLSPALAARMVTSVTALADGYDIGSMSGAIVLLQKDIPLSSGQVGAIVGIAYLAMGIGAPVGGSFADSLGRKKTLALTYILLMIASLMSALAATFPHLLVARAILGLGIGGGMSVVSTYMTEVSPKAQRGCYVGLEDLFLVLGISVGYAFNYLLTGIANDWRWMLGLGAIGPMIALVFLWVPQLPESPRWEMLQGRREEAVRLLVGLVGADEARHMLQDWESEPVAYAWSEVVNPRGSWRRRALIASMGVFFVASLAGVPVVNVYMGQILAHDTAAREGFLLSAIVAWTRLLFIGYTVFFLVDSVGRRRLTLISCAGTAVALGALAFAYRFEAAVLPWKLAALMLYFMAFSIGLAPIPFIYGPEVLPTEMRGKGVSLGMLCARLLSAGLSYIFPRAMEAYGVHVVFAGMALINVGGLLFIWAFMLETAGVSLEEIHYLFGGGDRKLDRRYGHGF